VLFPHQPECDFTFEDSEKEMIPPITEEQLMEACGRVKNTKAPGLDEIPNTALKTAVNAMPGIFLNIYNTCLQEGPSRQSGNSRD